MARLRGHRALDVGQPVYVKRAFLSTGGKTFEIGEELPWREMGLSPRKLQQLWDQRRVGHEKPGERNGAESANPERKFATAPLPSSAYSVMRTEDGLVVEVVDDLSDADLDALTAPESPAAPFAGPSPSPAAQPDARTDAQATSRKRRR